MLHRLFTLCAVVALAGSVSFAQDTAKPPKFSEIVASRFDDWDTNDDGVVSDTEVDLLCIDPAVKGPEAAAVATIKRIVRSGKVELPPLTKAYLAREPARRGRTPTSENADRADSPEVEVADGNTPATPDAPRPAPRASAAAAPVDFQSRYDQCLKKIQKTDRDLFGSEKPLSIARCKQGPLGNCFFVSVVGGAIDRDPQSIRKMIEPKADGAGYTVTFGNGRKVEVGPLTEAELGISSTTGVDGVWLAVLEKALGTTRRADSPSRHKMLSPTDAIARGGNTGSSITMLTGHTTERITLKRKARKPELDQSDINQRRIAGTSAKLELAADAEKLAKSVRERVQAALAINRLVAAGTGEEKLPPGISGKHAYAILGYDQEKDTLRIWNPHNNTRVVRGEPGLKTGYPTKGGVFEMPVGDFVRVFNGVTIETGNKARGPRA